MFTYFNQIKQISIWLDWEFLINGVPSRFHTSTHSIVTPTFAKSYHGGHALISFFWPKNYLQYFKMLYYAKKKKKIVNNNNNNTHTKISFSHKKLKTSSNFPKCPKNWFQFVFSPKSLLKFHCYIKVVVSYVSIFLYFTIDVNILIQLTFLTLLLLKLFSNLAVHFTNS